MPREWYTCLRCGYPRAIPRSSSRLRPKKHTKTMFCPVCARKKKKQVTNFKRV